MCHYQYQNITVDWVILIYKMFHQKTAGFCLHSAKKCVHYRKWKKTSNMPSLPFLVNWNTKSLGPEWDGPMLTWCYFKTIIFLPVSFYGYNLYIIVPFIALCWPTYWPFLSWILTSDPLSRRSCIMSRLPMRAAWCRADILK